MADVRSCGCDGRENEELRIFFFFLGGSLFSVSIVEREREGGRKLRVLKSKHKRMMKIRPYRLTLSQTPFLAGTDFAGTD